MGGIGAGDASMQRVAGSKNPAVDAAMGGMDASTQRQELEAQAEQAQEVEDLRAILIEAVTGGQWSLPGDGRPPREQVESIEGSDAKLLKYWHGEYASWKENQLARMGEEDEEVVKGLFRLGPDHPEYRAVLDRERRKRIEDGLVPLDFSQLMMRGYVDQTILIRKGFAIVLRSLTTGQGQWLERLGRVRLAELSTIEQQHTYALWQISVSLQAYVVEGRHQNVGNNLEALTRDNEFDAFVQAVDARMEQLRAKPEELTHDFIAQYVWFCGRVRALISGDTVKRLGNS
jgi:hypothetical protein